MAAEPTKKLAKKPTKKVSNKQSQSVDDQGESVDLMEPIALSEDCKKRGEINQLVFDLTQSATQFRASIPAGMIEPLCDLVRSMNCYYSNKIEGHDTHPISIERALVKDFDTDKTQRDLQLEARAHIATQRWIDEGNIRGRENTISAALDVHHRFESALPESLLWVENPQTGEREKVIPGEYRKGYARVGKHIAPSPGAVPRFMTRWEKRFSNLNKFESVLQSAAAHHRLLWIHPFVDGNGRVTRLISYAILAEALDSGGIWSIARGLARNSKEYKSLLSNCDLQRRNELDGRGQLSEEELVKFTFFFLKVCIDQVEFMQKLMDPAALRKRIMDWSKEEERVGALIPNSSRVLAHILTHRELERKDASEVTGEDARKARRITAELVKRGAISSRTHKAPFTLSFPAALAPTWLPGLYPKLT